MTRVPRGSRRSARKPESMDTSEPTFLCSYCLRDKPEAERSDEHIWPQSLGGDPLGPPWRTDNVCQRCNSLAGQFVDAAFVKSMIGLFERASGTEEYLDPSQPEKMTVPFVYMGAVEHDELHNDEVAEVWLGPAGDVVTHIRPRHDEVWEGYAGGKPTRKRSQAGNAYLAFASETPFWAAACFWSFQKQFKFAARSLLNAPLPTVELKLTPLDPDDAEQARQVRIAESMQGEIKANVTIPTDLGNRLIVKVALGLGRETLGEAFARSSYAQQLSRALWTRDPETRAQSRVHGSGFLATGDSPLAQAPIAWPGGWLLLLMLSGGRPSLTVFSPSGKMATILISDLPITPGTHPHWSQDGEVFLVIPTLGESLGPIDLPDYLAFIIGEIDHPDLRRLADRRKPPDAFPEKR